MYDDGLKQIRITHSCENRIHGKLEHPDHDFYIETADTHARLYVDGVFVLHADMWNCLMHLISLTD